MDAMNLPGIVNRGSPKLAINEMARELIWFCLRHRITTSVEWVPREENAFVDAISNMLILLEDYMLSRGFFGLLDCKWGPHTVNLIASNATNQCTKLFSLHWCKGSSWINAFSHIWSEESYWIYSP
jgi:hypothetical protein